MLKNPKILKNLDKLEQSVSNRNTQILPFVDTLWDIKTLDEIVYKKNLQEIFEEVITVFKDSLMELHYTFGIPITNKCNIIISHLADYFKRNGKSLLLTSDQTAN